MSLLAAISIVVVYKALVERRNRTAWGEIAVMRRLPDGCGVSDVPNVVHSISKRLSPLRYQFDLSDEGKH